MQNQDNIKSIMQDNTGSNTKIYSEKIIFKSKFFKIKQVTLKRNGRKFTKDIIERSSIALILPLTEKNEVYLVTQYRDALKKVSLEVIAGMMDKNETPLQAAKRELQEETGLTARNWIQIATLNISANMIAEAHVFVARNLKEGVPNLDEDEDIQTVKMHMKDAVKKALNGEIAITSNISALLIADSLQKEGKL